jgi:hypothetical protein
MTLVSLFAALWAIVVAWRHAMNGTQRVEVVGLFVANGALNIL